MYLWVLILINWSLRTNFKTNTHFALQNVKTQTVVKLTVVPCPPVVEVLIKRPDVKYQLGFSVQNGVVCIIIVHQLLSKCCSTQLKRLLHPRVRQHYYTPHILRYSGFLWHSWACKQDREQTVWARTIKLGTHAPNGKRQIPIALNSQWKA